MLEPYLYGKGVVNLGEYVLKLYTGCQQGCKYCFVEKKTPTVCVDLRNLKSQIKEIYKTVKKKLYINCGENADSLLCERDTHLIKDLAEILKDENVLVELRTKIADVEPLFGVPYFEKFIVCFSIVPEKIRKKYESNTDCINKRISAMGRCADFGYKVGIRFEPIINIEDLKIEYEELMKKILEVVPVKNIYSISFGVIRFTHELIKKLSKDPSAYELLLGEIVQCPDGKFRYFRKIRVGIYKELIKLAHKHFKKPLLYLSTEFDYIWYDCGLRPLRFE